MSDLEKAPLLPLGTTHSDSPSNDAPPTEESALQVLRDEVKRTQTAAFEASRQYSQAWQQTRTGRRLRVFHNIILSIVGTFSVLLISGMVFAIGSAIIDGDDGWTPPRRIPLEAHIMSKCPDARDCLRDMVLPVMQRVGRQQVDFRLSYIGRHSEADDGVECLHGPEECLGNILELCAAQLYPDPKIYLGFTMCMTRDYKEVPDKELVQACALEHGISFERLNGCASDEHAGRGIDLLRKSVERSARGNVTTSCTVRLDHKTWCVRDDGEWKDCEGGSGVEDLVGEIKRLRNESTILS